MKILFLQDNFPPESLGGAGFSALTIAKELRDKGHDIYVVTTVQETELEREEIYEGIKVYRIYSNYCSRWRSYLSLYHPSTVERVREILSEVRPEIVHARNIHYHLSYHCLKLAKRLGAKVFYTAHDVMPVHFGKMVFFIDPKDLSVPEHFNYHIPAWLQMKQSGMRYNPFRNLIVRYYLRYADKVFAVSEELKNVLEQNRIQNVSVLYNGIDVDEWRGELPVADKHGFKHHLDGKRVILFGGRLSRAKGGELIICAFEHVAKTVPDARLVVVGKKGVHAQQLLDILSKKGLAEKVLFTGWISGDRLKAAYQAANVVVVPSVCFDSLPRVALEAMASAKPVVATCFGGSREIVHNGVNGYIVNPYDIKQLARRISELVQDPALAEQMGLKGHEIVKRLCDQSKQAEKHLRWYLSTEY